MSAGTGTSAFHQKRTITLGGCWHKTLSRKRERRPGEGYAACRKIMLAFVPPNPKLFDSAALIRRSCAVWATRSIGLSRLGSSRFSVGGATLSRMARMEKIDSTAPA